MKLSHVAAFLLLAIGGCAPAANAQSTLLQGGPITPGHSPMYLNSGSSQAVVQDSGPAGGGAVGLGMSEGLYVARGTGTAPYAGQGTGPLGTNWCDYDAPITNATGYHFFCLSPNVGGNGLIAYGSGGAATPGSLNLSVNGTTYQFPFAISGIVGPPTTVVNDLALWNNTSGTLLKDSSAIPSNITATTQSPGDNSTKIATTAFVANAVGTVVTGPGSSAVGDFALWNNTSGTLLKDTTPSQVSAIPLYTAPGTGGVIHSITDRFDRTIWANDYGAVCNGSTNDRTAFQNAINAAEAARAPLRWLGNCSIQSTLNITSQIDFGGVGSANSPASSNSSQLIAPPTINVITVTTSESIYLHDFSIAYTSLANAGTTGIYVDAPGGQENQFSKFERLSIGYPSQTANIGIWFNRASLWTIYNTTIGFNTYGVRVENNNVTDSGDSVISDTYLFGNAGGKAVEYLSSSGLHLVNSKTNGTNLASAFEMIAPAATSPLVDLWILGNSFEGLSATAAAISIFPGTVTASMTNVIIANNEISKPQYCVLTQAGAAGSWLHMVTISNNTCDVANTANSTGYSMDGLDTFEMDGGVFNSAGAANTRSITLGSAAIKGKVTPPRISGTVIDASYQGATNYIIDVQGLLAAGLPATAANGSQIFVRDGSPTSSPCTGASTGSMAFRQNGAWKCF